MERVDVMILGRDYSLACPPEEKPRLLEAVRYVDRYMAGLQSSGKAGSNERIAVMVALQIASEMLAMKASEGPFGGVSVGDFKSKIDHMHSVIDDALSGQEKLL